MTPQPSILRPLELLRVLVDAEAEFVVIGGFALAAYGHQRATKDVDIVPAPDTRNLAVLFAALASIDAHPIEAEDFRAEELPVPLTPESLADRGNSALATTLGRVDLMQEVAGVESYDSLRRRAESRDLPDVGRVWFSSRDDLITMKRAAGRPEDLIDVERLNKAAG